MTEQEILDLIRDVNHDYIQLQEQREMQKKKREVLQEKLNVLEPFLPWNWIYTRRCAISI